MKVTFKQIFLSVLITLFLNMQIFSFYFKCFYICLISFYLGRTEGNSEDMFTYSLLNTSFIDMQYFDFIGIHSGNVIFLWYWIEKFFF